MPRLMADNDVQGPFDAMVEYLSSPEWKEFWLDAQLAAACFEDVQLSRTAADALVWQTCQAQEIVLVTGNRNDDGPESLEATLRSFNELNCLPVVTLTNPQRMRRNKQYLHRCAVKLLELMMDLDKHRGAGRLYIP